MTPADRQTLARKLAYLQKNIESLEPYQKIPVNDLIENRKELLVIERLLQTAIESVIDCSRLLAALQDWRRMRDERDALIILEERGVLPENLGKRLLEAKGFRNVLVHEYVEIKPELVLENLQGGLADLRAFAVSMAKWLESAS